MASLTLYFYAISLDLIFVGLVISSTASHISLTYLSHSDSCCATPTLSLPVTVRSLSLSPLLSPSIYFYSLLGSSLSFSQLSRLDNKLLAKFRNASLLFPASFIHNTASTTNSFVFPSFGMLNCVFAFPKLDFLI